MPDFKTPPDATPIDADGLKLRSVKDYADLSAAEMESFLAARDKHLKRHRNPLATWLTDEFICRVHRDMFGRVWKWAGQIRKTELSIGVPVYAIRPELKKLWADFKVWNSGSSPMPLLEQVVRIHHRLAYIHPFKNGNGRLARLISDIFLYAHHHPLPEWPARLGEEQDRLRSDYLKALRDADHGDMEGLLSFSRRCLPPAPCEVRGKRREG